MKEWPDEDFEPDGQEDNQKLIEFLGKLWVNWYWFALFGFLGLMVAYVNLRYSTPVYKINAKLLVTEEQKGASATGTGVFLGDLNSLFGGVNSVDNEAEILKTRYLMEQVVRKQNAQVNYFVPGDVRDVEVYPAPFDVTLLRPDSLTGGIFRLQLKDNEHISVSQDHFEQETTFGTTIDLPGVGSVLISRNTSVPISKTTYRFEVASFDTRVNEYMGRLSVGVTNKQVSIIDLAFDYPIKAKGESILRTILETYTENNLQDKNTIADSTIAFIDNRLLFVGQELGAVEGDIQAFRQSKQLADISAQSQLLLENSAEYVKQLTEVETQLTILDNLRGYLIDPKNQRVVPSALLPNDMVFNGLVERYNTLLLERDRRLLSATPDNPTVRNLDQQLANLRTDMLANLENTRNRFETTRNELRRKTGQLESEVRRVPATERQYLDLARQQQIKQELYIYLLQKREETAISKTANISNSRIIDPPKAKTLPFSPRRTRTLAMGLLIGLIIPATSIYLRDLLNTRIRNREDIQKQTPLPIVGEISHSTSKQTLVVTRDSRAPIAEQFRSLRTNLAFYLSNIDKPTILLTSSMSGEGKSFVALNMAMIFAISGKKVIVLEMDLRKPNLSIKLNISNSFGFTNYIISPSQTPESIIRPSGVHEGLYLISSGPIPPNPAEMILHERTGELMTYLKREFDVVIIDAPPIGLVTDAQLLSHHADLTLYLARQGYTYKRQLRIPTELYHSGKMKQIALVVNDIQKAKTNYGYGYGYGYGEYGNEKQEKRKWWKLFSKKNS
ncbi:polysaccharide biosynthesis tyrosine autokinase [Parapedobacter defluvii]|uniref:GumC family protein n=1 Tax=Parapedobacter defluvii TaxID=2045106 RepID=UPI0033402AA6